MRSAEASVETGSCNEVRLVGRVTSAPEERELPSGDVLLTFRVTLDRTRTPMTSKSRQRSDWVDCAVWGARVRRTVGSWRVGDVVAVDGALRRRFYRSGGITTTRMEVEVLSARRVERARDERARAGRVRAEGVG